MAIEATTSTTNNFAALNGEASTITQNEAGSADRFLKLLVAQMENQDPLNPMDNAQVTSQMAQINTVDGINRLNTTVTGLNAQFAQLQALQGASLLGREVSVKGDRLAISGDGEAAVGSGGYELSGSADAVRVEILNGAGQVLASENLGKQTAGRHDFEWTAAAHTAQEGLRFRVVATQGTTQVTATPMMFDRVLSVSAGSDTLKLDLESSGSVNYSDVRTVREGG